MAVLALLLALATLPAGTGGASAAAEGPGNGTVTNASQILGRIPLKQLRLLVPSTPVYEGSKQAVTLVSPIPAHPLRGEDDYAAPLRARSSPLALWQRARSQSPPILTGTLAQVFSRSVIKLGSNWGSDGDSGATVRGVHPLLWSCNGGSPAFPHGPPIHGRTWWVTTAILRFDPTEGWGSDLRCTVRANPLLRSWDGARLLPWTGKAFGFNTTELEVSQVEVSSALAAAATDGQWHSELAEEYPYGQPLVHECPSDCLVNVSFQNSGSSATIDATTLEKHFCLVRNASKWGDACRKVKVTKRDGDNTGFTIVPPALQFNTVYNITLPKGVVVSNISGPTVAVSMNTGLPHSRVEPLLLNCFLEIEIFF